MRGYVYILVNPSMPGLVKIGKTSKHPSERAKELQQTGIPTPFLVAYHAHVDDMDFVEREMHSRLSKYREASNREFFKIEPTTAIDELLAVVEGIRLSDDECYAAPEEPQLSTSAYLVKLNPQRGYDRHELPITLPRELLSMSLDNRRWVEKLKISPSKIHPEMLNIYGGGFFKIYRLGLSVLDKVSLERQLKSMFEELNIAADIEILRYQQEVPKVDVRQYLEDSSAVLLSKEIALGVTSNEGVSGIWEKFIAALEVERSAISRLLVEAQSVEVKRSLKRKINDFDRYL